MLQVFGMYSEQFVSIRDGREMPVGRTGCECRHLWAGIFFSSRIFFNFLIGVSSVANGTVGHPAAIPDPDGADISGNAGHDLLNGLHCPI